MNHFKNLTRTTVFIAVILVSINSAALAQKIPTPCERSNFVLGDACSLPFGADGFDVATTVDVFEHIPTGKRAAFLDELFRVSKEYIILAAPFDSDAVVSAERLLFEFVRRVLDQDFAEVHPLREHIENGLPSSEYLQRTIDLKNSSCIYFPKGQLNNWLRLNLIKHHIFSIPESQALEKMLDRFYNCHLVSGRRRGAWLSHRFCHIQEPKTSRAG